MIRLKVEINGEQDTLPFTRIFDYRHESDEIIFYHSLQIIKRKLADKLRINTNEALVIYSGYIVDQLRIRNSIQEIQKSASKLLSHKDVMIGVPESLSTIKFEAFVDRISEKRIILRQPIPATGYILMDKENTDTRYI
jgi:urease gamma subunit